MVEDFPRARACAEALEIPFHEVQLLTNAQNIYVVFSDLEVTTLETGYTRFVLNNDE